MTARTIRRRFGEFVAAHDWLEGVSVVLGFVFFVLAALCAWSIVTAVASWGDVEPAVIEGRTTTVGFLKVTRGFGIVLFALFGFLAAGVGWFLAGEWIRSHLRRSRTSG